VIAAGDRRLELTLERGGPPSVVAPAVGRRWLRPFTVVTEMVGEEREWGGEGFVGWFGCTALEGERDSKPVRAKRGDQEWAVVRGSALRFEIFSVYMGPVVAQLFFTASRKQRSG